MQFTSYYRYSKGDPYIDYWYNLAREESITTVGKGIIFDCEDDEVYKFLMHYIEEEEIDRKVRCAVLYQCLYGGSISFLLPREDGTFSYEVTPYSINARTVCYHTDEVGAHIRYFPNVSDESAWVELTYTPKFIDYKEFSTKEIQLMDGQNVSIDVPEKIVKHFRIGNKLNHVIPVKTVLHKPWQFVGYNNNTYTPLAMNGASSSYNILLKIEFFWNIFFKEVMFNRTRIIVDVDANTVNDINKTDATQGYDGSAWEKDIFLKSVSSNGDRYSSSSVAGTMILQGNQAGQPLYIESINSLVRMFWEADGFNYRSDASGVYESRATTVQGDNLTTKTLAVMRPKNLPYKLLDIILKLKFPKKSSWLDGELREYTLSFRESHAIDTAIKIDNVLKKLSVNIISKVDAISEVETINVKQAQMKLDKIVAETQETKDVFGMPADAGKQEDKPDADNTSDNPII